MLDKYIRRDRRAHEHDEEEERGRADGGGVPDFHPPTFDRCLWRCGDLSRYQRGKRGSLQGFSDRNEREGGDDVEEEWLRAGFCAESASTTIDGEFTVIFYRVS